MLTTVSDEERRFNINTLLDSRTGTFIDKRKSFMTELLKNMGVKEAELNGFLEELKDQLDPDTTGKYESELRNGAFQRLSDLTICEHVDKVLFEGSMYPEGELVLEEDSWDKEVESDLDLGENEFVFFAKSEALPYEEWDQDEIFPGLKDLLTVYGDGKININTAPLPILTVLFGEERTALDVIRSRKLAPFRSVEDLAVVANAQSGIAKFVDMISFSSKYFRVTLQLQQRSVLRRRVSLVSREGSQLTTLFRGAIL
jgi:type II secretory pathway component PulK